MASIGRVSFDARHLFDCIDRRDWAGFGSFLTDDVVFRYGSQAPVQGRDAVLAAAAAALAPFSQVEHRFDRQWADPHDTVVAGQVIYTLPAGRQIPLDFLNRFRMRDGKIREYLIHIDASPVLAALQGTP